MSHVLPSLFLVPSDTLVYTEEAFTPGVVFPVYWCSNHRSTVELIAALTEEAQPEGFAPVHWPCNMFSCTVEEAAAMAAAEARPEGFAPVHWCDLFQYSVAEATAWAATVYAHPEGLAPIHWHDIFRCSAEEAAALAAAQWPSGRICSNALMRQSPMIED